MKTIPVLALLAACLFPLSAAANDDIRTLQNLERERAQLLINLLNSELLPAERVQKLAFTQRRLVDMERMTIRDDRLVGSRSPLVRSAFNHYELTFLAHASAERDLSVVDHWFDQIGLNSAAILQSRKRIR